MAKKTTLLANGPALLAKAMLKTIKSCPAGIDYNYFHGMCMNIMSDRDFQKGFMLLKENGLIDDRNAIIKAIPECTCRKAKRHRDCAYCGVTSHSDGKICGVCKADGIDGKVIRGTSGVTCQLHKTSTVKKETPITVNLSDELNRKFKRAISQTWNAICCDVPEGETKAERVELVLDAGRVRMYGNLTKDEYEVFRQLPNDYQDQLANEVL